MPKPLRGGMAAITPQANGAAAAVSISQPENPAAASTQDHEVSDATTVPIPAGSTITQRTSEIAPSGKTNTTELVVTVTAPTEVKRVRTEATKQVVGPAQKDMGREVAAKLASFRGLQWLGALVFLFGVVSLFYPPLKLIIGSVTTSAVIAGAGLALIVLPSLIVGNELLILGGAGAVAVAYWFAHRHGELRGVVTAMTDAGARMPDPKPPEVTK